MTALADGDRARFRLAMPSRPLIAGAVFASEESDGRLEFEGVERSDDRGDPNGNPGHQSSACAWRTGTRAGVYRSAPGLTFDLPSCPAPDIAPWALMRTVTIVIAIALVLAVFAWTAKYSPPQSWREPQATAASGHHHRQVERVAPAGGLSPAASDGEGEAYRDVPRFCRGRATLTLTGRFWNIKVEGLACPSPDGTENFQAVACLRAWSGDSTRYPALADARAAPRVARASSTDTRPPGAAARASRWGHPEKLIGLRLTAQEHLD